MATVASTPRSTTITLASATAGPFEVGFRLFDTDTLEVYLNGQRTSAWTLSAAFTDGYSDGATITFTAELDAGDVVQIDGALQPRREADYLITDPGLTRKLNVEMARLWAGLSEVKRKSETSLRTFGPAIPFTPVPGASVGFDDEGNPTSGPLFGEIASAAAAAQTAVEARDEVVEVAGSIVSADLIERSVVGDGVVASLTFPGTYSLKTNFIDVTIGGVQQSQDAFTLVPSGTNTVLTFPTPIPIGLTARAKATSQLVSEVAEEDQITDLSTKSVADRAAALAWIAAHGAPPVGFRLAWDGVAVRYIGSGAVIADMPGYVPDGDARLEHWGGGAGASSAANWSAWQAAYAAYDAIHFGPGFYNFGTNRLEITKNNFRLYGARNNRTHFQWSASASGMRVSPPSPGTATGFINGFQMYDIALVGAGVTATGLGLELIMCNGPRVERVDVQGFRNQWKVAGGQLGRFLSITGFAPTGSLVADVTGTSVLHIGPHIRDDLSATPAYTHYFDQITLAGDSNKNVEHTIKIGSGDGIQFGQGYVAYGRTSNFYLEPEADAPAGNITATATGQLYFDGVGQADGTEYGILFGTTAFTGRVNNLRVGSGTFIGNYQKSAIYSRANSLIGLFIDGANLSGCDERVVDIEGVTGASGSRIVIGGGTTIRNGTLGGAKIVGARLIQVTGCTFSDNAGADGALYVGGTISELVVQGNSYVGNSADFTNAGTLRPRGDAIKGTFTPTVEFGGASVGVTYSVQQGNYSIVDDRLIFNMRIVLTSKGSSTGNLRIRTNLPTALNALERVSLAIELTAIASGTAERFMSATVAGGSSYFDVNRMGVADATVLLTDANLNNNSTIYISGQWRIAT